ncbi:MAG: hypothetical protein HZB51_24100 [Chloroflexi bacterium]|nr:hypothetical protein [Chloroflexota bacterium]
MSVRITRITLSFAVLSTLLGITLILAPNPSNVAFAQGGSAEQIKLQRLATATRRSAANLKLTDEASFTLLNGKKLERLKAIDVRMSEIVGGTFDGDQAVDEPALRAQAAAEWRAAHGALTPETVNQLQTLNADDKLNIAVWLVANIQPLPQSDHIYSESSSAFSTSSTIDQAPTAGANDVKLPAKPIPESQIPAEVKVRFATATTGASASLPASEKSTGPQAPVIDHTARAAQVAQAQVFHRQNTDAVRGQIAPVRAQFIDLMQSQAIQVDYASETVPMAVVNGVTRTQIENLAFLPEIDAIYIVPDHAGPSLANARPTQNADLINSVGYNGSGVNVSVTEGERASSANPYLAITGFYNSGAASQSHPTAVSGMIKSTATGFNGLANGVTLYNGNGSYSNWATMTAAMDYGSTNAKVLNNSWYWDSPNSAVFWEADRHQDYFVRYYYDFVVVAAGNFGNGCGSNFSTYVVSPAKGYNVLSVGNYEDYETLGWSGDAMSVCSSFGDPASDSASPTHSKPEVSAVGSSISSTTTSNPWIGGVGSGTSYSSPMVTSLAADLIEANATLANRPAALRSIIMATALHNIEGSGKYSDIDGAGGIDATAAAATVERGNWDERSIDSSTIFPITLSQFAYKGERVRFVINWLSNPNVSYTTDSLPADLDLRAYRANGTTLLDSSTSSANNFEIVDFIAPESETYQFRISKTSFTGSATWLGSAWWRGTYRISPDMGFTDPKATPLGTHISVYPGDWSYSNYWRGLGVRSPSGTDHDIELDSASWFDDPSTRSILSGSTYGNGMVDFVAVDGNRRGTTPEFYRINNFAGTDGYNINWSSQGIGIYTQGWYGPYNIGSSEAVKVFDVYFNANQARQISIVPTGSNNTNLGVALYQSNSADASTWTRRRAQYGAYSDASTSTSVTERIVFKNTLTGAWHGLVVFSNNNTSGQFYVVVNDLKLYLPLILK